MKEITISRQEAGQRVDKFVRKMLPDAPLSFIYKVFRKKDVKINGKWARIEDTVKEGDTLRVYVTDEQLADFMKKPRPVENLKANLEIIYEDDNVLVISKPKGILVHGDETEKRMTLTNLVLNYLYQKGEYDPKNILAFAPSPAHRLDRNTSGLVLFAKNLEALKSLTELIKDKENVKKEYLALVSGRTDSHGRIDFPLRKDEGSGLVLVDHRSKDSKEALTLYSIKEKFNDYTLLLVELVTGRTHQIRVHLKSIGHPVVGDGKYGEFLLNREFKSRFDYEHQFLHAYRFSFLKVDGYLSYLSHKAFTAPLFAKEREIIEELRKE